MNPREKSRSGKPIRVLQFTGIDQTLRFLIPLIKALQADGFEVFAAADKSEVGPDLKAEGIEFFDLQTTRKLAPLQIIKAVLATARLIRKQSIDIIHAHTYSGGMIGRLAGWLAGVPFSIYMGHGWLYTPRTTWWKKRIIIFTEKIFRLITDCFFLISEEEMQTGLRDHIIKQHDDSVLTLGVGVNCEKFDPALTSPKARLALREQLGLGPNEYAFCFIGRIVEEKGLLELGKAFTAVRKDYPHVRLIVVGSTSESERDRSCREKLLAQLARDGCTDAVNFTGQMPDVRDALSACDAYVLPTYREGMPVALLEAMAMGLPCIATDIPGCREEIVDGKTGYLVQPRQVAPLQHRMEDLLKDPQAAHAMGRAARARVLELFSIEKVLEIQLAAYRRIRRKLTGSTEPGR